MPELGRQLMPSVLNMDKALLSEVGGPSPAALERLIYVVGSARGGTSITRALIALHDNVIAMDGPSSFLNHVWRYRNRLHDRLWRQLLWTPGYLRRAAVRDSLPEKRKQALLRLINKTSAEKKLHDLYQLYPLVKALDPDEKRDPGAFHAWLDKGNDFWGVDELSRAFPEGRFIFVIRDPRGAIASLAKRVADQRSDTEFVVEPADVIKSAIYWRNLLQKQLRFAARNPERTIFFRFEDLTLRPVAVTQSLFKAIDMPSLPDDELRQRIDGLAYGTSLDRHERGKGISSAPNDRWKSMLDQGSVDLISELCGASARVFGYDIPPSSRRLGLLGVLRSIPGMKSKAIVCLKLAYLTLMDLRPGGFGRTAALRFLAVE